MLPEVGPGDIAQIQYTSTTGFPKGAELTHRGLTNNARFYAQRIGGGEDRVERVGELPGAVADQEVEVCGAVPEVHEEVADLLGGPWAVRMGGDPRGHERSGSRLR